MATNKSKRYFVLDSYTLCLCCIDLFVSHLIYLSFNQTHNAAMLLSKCETFFYRYITPNFVGHSFRVEGETWCLFANSALCILI